MKGLRELLVALPLAASCGRSEVEAAFRPVFKEVALPPEAPSPLLGYRWEGRGLVPWVSGERLERVPYGPLGRTPSTLLYLTFDGPAELELEGARPAWSLRPLPVQAAEGRFAGGARLAVGEALTLARVEPESLRALTVEFWVRPENLARGPLLTIPGVLELSCRERGELRLAVTAGQGQRASGTATLASGRWSRVGIVVDPLEIQTARLVLDQQAFWCPLTGLEPLPAFPELRLGGGDVAFEIDELRLSARAANTAELIEAFDERPRALERLDLLTDECARSLEVWTDFQREPVLDSVAEWSRGVLEHATSGVDGLRWVSGDWRELSPLDPPLARTCHPTVYLGDGRLFVFSGEVRDSHLPPMRNVADTWFFHTREARWERVETETAPPGRCHQQAAYSPDHDLVLMASGWGNGPGENVRFADTWVFHVQERRWEERHPQGETPLRGGEWALVYHPGVGRFLIFCGRRVSAYDPVKDRWDTRAASVSVTDEAGRPSDYVIPNALSAAYDPVSGNVVLFGGEGADQTFYDKTLIYEPAANRFVVLDLTTHPAPRVRPGFAYDSKRARIVLFGGVRDQFSRRMDDLWEFDPAARRWSRLDAAGTPEERGGFMLMAYEPELERFFLVGGRHAPERFLEEVWTLAVDPRATGRARVAFDRAGFAERAWFYEGDVPADAELAFRFRASEDALAWSEWSTNPPSTPRYVEVEVKLRASPSGATPTLRAMGFR